MLIPIGHEDQQVRRLPWVTILLVAANVVVFLLTNQAAQQHGAEMRGRVREIVRYAQEHPYLRVPPEMGRAMPSAPPGTDLPPETIAEEQARLDAMWEQITSAEKQSPYRTYGYTPSDPKLWTIFSSMFLHGGWLHLLGNMLFLWLAGASLEDRWGRLLYAVLYVASGAVAVLIHAAMNPQSSTPVIGASGAIAGLMGAFLIRLATTRIRFFYWFLFVRGTFVMPAYVALPLWLLQQFAMVRSGAGGGIAVWAHIGGFLFGVLAASILKLTDVEKNFLAPALTKKTAWSPSEHLMAALERLDRGDTAAGIRDLVAFLKRNPNSIEARAALIAAYTQAGDAASAGRESARLVSAYVVAREFDGGLAALEEHRRLHPDVPVPLRSLLALAAHREKQERYREAADLYQAGMQAWPNDPLVPKALIAYGRVMLDVFQQPDDTLAVLEGALASPQMTPEFKRAAEELVASARRARRLAARAPEPVQAAPEFEATSLTARLAETRLDEPIASAPVPSVEMKPAAPPLQSEMTPEVAAGPAPIEEPAVALQPMEPLSSEPPAEELPTPQPSWKLLPVCMRAVNIDARGLHLQNRAGKIGQLPWQSIVGVAVAKIEDPAGQQSGRLILDLLMAPKSRTEADTVRCVRLAGEELALPQLQAEPSPTRAFQRIVATILKTTKATAYPSRDDCLGLRGFPTFSDLESYETALLACLRLAA